MVKNITNGAKAPSSPTLCNHNDYTPFYKMVDWYYRNEFTISIDCYDIDDRICVIEISERVGESNKHKTFTIGPSTRNLIISNYYHYHR